MKMSLPYSLALLQYQKAYQAKFFPDVQRVFEQVVPGPKPLVFLKETADSNILFHPEADSEGRARLLDLIPAAKRNRLFRSMISSQALTQTLLGNLKDYGCLSLLADLQDDSGEPLFGEAILAAKNLTLEHDASLPNTAPFRLDGFISGNYRVVLECKLAESEVGPCPRPDGCNGTYTLQRERTHRCALSARGLPYWDQVPKLFNDDWDAGADLSPCPLKDSLQLVRNVLAACTKDDGTLSPAAGHAVLLYDERNPAFQPGGAGFAEFNRVRSNLKRHELLRKCSWQIVLAQLSNVHSMRWLAEALNAKYGFLTTRF